MDDALAILLSKLMSTGMSRTAAEARLAKFLEEEAFDFVECMEELMEHPERMERYRDDIYQA